MVNPAPEKAAITEASLEEDELFLEQLKDSFCFFFAATVTIMEVVKYLSPHASNNPHASNKRKSPGRSSAEFSQPSSEPRP